MNNYKILYNLLSNRSKNSGPGTVLKGILKDWFGIVANGGCSCNSMVIKMDKLGPDWCESEQGMNEILRVMKLEYEKRYADNTISLPWSEICVKQLIKLSCYGSRNR